MNNQITTLCFLCRTCEYQSCAFICSVPVARIGEAPVACRCLISSFSGSVSSFCCWSKSCSNGRTACTICCVRFVRKFTSQSLQCNSATRNNTSHENPKTTRTKASKQNAPCPCIHPTVLHLCRRPASPVRRPFDR